MAKSLNKVQIIGRLGQDPQANERGKIVANFSIATDESYKSKDGTYQSNTEWHRIVAYGRLAEIVFEYLFRGSLVYIEGKLRTRQWTDSNDFRHYITEIVANNIIMLDSRQNPKANTSSVDEYSNELPESSEDDEDLPF